MTRNQYVITKTDGTKMTVWGNGYEVNAYGILSIGQMEEKNGQWIPMLVLSLKAEKWESIHQVRNGREQYLDTGAIKPVGLVVQ